MAYVERNFRANDGSGPMSHYFNLHDAVGRGCPNRPDDVALVQLFLQSLGNLPDSPVQGATLEIDGIWSSGLERGVRIFQRIARRWLRNRNTGETLLVDGLTLPARGLYIEGRRMYTIIALNKSYAHYYWNDYRQLYLMTRITGGPGQRGTTATRRQPAAIVRS